MSQQRGKGRRRGKGGTSRTTAPARGAGSRGPGSASRGPSSRGPGGSTASGRGPRAGASTGPNRVAKRSGSSSVAGVGSRTVGSSSVAGGIAAAAAKRRQASAIAQGASPVPYLLGVGGAAIALIALLIALDSQPDIKPPEFSNAQRREVKRKRYRQTTFKRGDDPVRARAAALEKEIVAAREFQDAQFAKVPNGRYPGPGQMEQVLERWIQLEPKVKGSEFESFVLSRLIANRALREEAGMKRARDMRLYVQSAAEVSDWDRVYHLIDKFPAIWKESPKVATYIGTLRAEMKDWQRRWEASKIKYYINMDNHQAGKGIQLSYVRDGGIHKGWLKLSGDHSGRADFICQLTSNPGPKVYLYLSHTSTILGHLANPDHRRGYSPVTIRVNDNVIVGEWTPGGNTTTRWNVAKYLRVGPNVISIALGDARSQYWLRRVELSDFEPN